jgi:hypothetical protein
MHGEECSVEDCDNLMALDCVMKRCGWCCNSVECRRHRPAKKDPR